MGEDLGKIRCRGSKAAGHLSFAVPVEGYDDKFVVGLDKQILLIDWNTYESKSIYQWIILNIIDASIPGNRLNYGTVDPLGKLVFGTMNTNGLRLANVSSLNYDLELTTHIKNIVSTVGIVFDPRPPRRPKVYVIDSGKNYDIEAYSYHRTSGIFGSSNVVFNWAQQGRIGHPRRLTVDKNSHLWVPIYEGRTIIQVDPASENVLHFFFTSEERVGACVFGGYRHERYHGIIPENDRGGSIFALKVPGVQGWPPKKYKMNMQEVWRRPQGTLFPRP
ncbi:regucalcin-like [Belonocnema kinseyi]|uniref:regucalcin-like n=1 Tax=Belonocnema kinseyi TaxID=2817044 RepID=UPI00143CCD42|nr:regucalcin-like [Belonocnema kinseyi]